MLMSPEGKKLMSEPHRDRHAQTASLNWTYMAIRSKVNTNCEPAPFPNLADTFPWPSAHRFDAALPGKNIYGDLGLWMADTRPCHAILLNLVDLGPTDPWQTPWKSLLNPDQVVLYHSRNGFVLEEDLAEQVLLLPGDNVKQTSSQNNTSKAMSQHKWRDVEKGLVEDMVIGEGEVLLRDDVDAERGAGQTRVPRDDIQLSDRKCAYLVHFINLFRDRRSVGGEESGSRNEASSVQGSSLQADVLPVVNQCQQQQQQQLQQPQQPQQQGWLSWPWPLD